VNLISQQFVTPIFCSSTSQDATPSFLLPTQRAHSFVSISRHGSQSPDAHTPPSFASSFLGGTDFYVSLNFLLYAHTHVSQVGYYISKGGADSFEKLLF
jgi:hypothetical protein